MGSPMTTVTGRVIMFSCFPMIILIAVISVVLFSRTGRAPTKDEILTFVNERRLPTLEETPTKNETRSVLAAARATAQEATDAVSKSLLSAPKSDTQDLVPGGYAPQADLLFNVPLKLGERLVATFQFTACKWVKKFGQTSMFPSMCATTYGIGHMTSEHILLFYDLKRMYNQSSWDGPKVETLGKYGGQYDVICQSFA